MTLEEQLYTLLGELSIAYTLYEHEPACTVEQAERVAQFVPGTHCKNLFLKDDKKQLWLFVARHDAVIKLKEVSRAVTASGLRFANPELLELHLGVKPGSVTPFGLIHDSQKAVHVIMDAGLLDAQLVGFHPLRNTATITLSPQDLVRFIAHQGNQMTVYKL